LKELINPIDEKRLELDSVFQVKQTVQSFYKKKNLHCIALLSELDKMTAERRKVLENKK